MATAYILSLRKHGESSAIVSLFCSENGKVKGLVSGLKKQAALLQPLVVVSYTHTRRLEHQLGRLHLECLENTPAKWLHSAQHIALLQYVSQLLTLALPESDPQPRLFMALHSFIQQLNTQPLWQHLAQFERQLLDDLGHGLALRPEQAVVCPDNSPLLYISPKTGRAVPQNMGEPWKERLLRLPHMWGGPETDEASDIQQTNQVLDTFLQEALQEQLYGKPLPQRPRV